MKRLVAITALVSGLLLILVPRYILPSCEYAGYPHMHCSDTAHAEFVIGALLIAIGGAVLYAKTEKLVMIAAGASFLFYIGAYWLPDKIGYCLSPHMPCNYGMVPGVRFVAVVGALIMTIVIVKLSKNSRRKR
jgi:hypothetical protein